MEAAKKTILERIAEDTRLRVDLCKEKVSFDAVLKKAQEIAGNEEKPYAFPFKEALRKEGLSFICEVKKASPSKGIIAEEFDYLAIAKDYEKAGAAAISVLTEPKYFLGSDQYLTEIAKEVSIPILRKDFIVDEYQIYEAKVIGASAILLICEITGEAELKKYLETAHSIGLSALVEAHTPEQIEKALRAGAEIIGVNNRDLTNFNVDIDTAKRLRELVPEEVLFVSESGIKTPADVEAQYHAGADGVLVGEALMRCEDKKEGLERLKSLLPERLPVPQKGMP